jgi:hypothetical protein
MTRFGGWKGLAVLIAAAALVFGAMPGTVLAHERRVVAGKYQFVVGFLQEPAVQGQLNGVDLRVTNIETNQPVTGLEKTLKVRVRAGGGPEKEFALEPRFNMPGVYAAYFIPSRPGGYVFTFVGTIDGQQINEVFQSGPGRFSDVSPTDELAFPPVAALDPAQIDQTISALSRRVADLEGASGRLTALAAAGAVLGLVGTGLGIIGLMRGRKG